MARVTGNGQTRPSLTSHLRDIRQTGCDVMSVLVSQESDVLLANLANGHDTPRSLPCCCHGFKVVIARFFTLFVVFFAVNEHNNVGVLLN